MNREAQPKSHRWPWVLGILGAAVATAVVVGWLMGPKVWTDERTIRVAGSRAQLREVLWTPPKSPGPQFESDLQQYEPSLSPDGSEFYFVRGKPGHNADIYASYRKNNQWTDPAPLDAVNSPYDDLGPRLTPDGRFLLFYSDRPGGFGGYDIWAAERTTSGWSKPFNLGPQVNSEFNEFSPDPTPDGKHLIFATNRKAANHQQKQAWKATIRETVSADYDLWIAEIRARAPEELGVAGATPSIDKMEPGGRRSRDTEASSNDETSATLQAVPATQAATQPWTAPAPTTQPDTQPGILVFKPASEIPGINTQYVEGASCMSPAGDFLYFASNRPGGFGNFDIWRSRISSDEAGHWTFAPPENVGPQINTAENEADPSLALNGFRLYFSSDRDSSAGIYRLLASDSREVYSTHESRRLPVLGLSFWLMLISLLLLVPLLMFLRGWEDSRLNTLQKCLLLSLMVHVGVCFALSFIRVTTQAFHYVRQEMGIELPIALNAPKDIEVGYAIRRQSTSDLPVAGAPPADLPQSQTPIETAAIAGPAEVNVPEAHVQPGQATIQLDVPRPNRIAAKPDAVAVQPLAPAADLFALHMAQPSAVSQAEAQPRVQAAAEPQVAKASLPGDSTAAAMTVQTDAGPAASAAGVGSAAGTVPSARPNPAIVNGLGTETVAQSALSSIDAPQVAVATDAPRQQAVEASPGAAVSADHASSSVATGPLGGMNRAPAATARDLAISVAPAAAKDEVGAGAELAVSGFVHTAERGTAVDALQPGPAEAMASANAPEVGPIKGATSSKQQGAERQPAPSGAAALTGPTTRPTDAIVSSPNPSSRQDVLSGSAALGGPVSSKDVGSLASAVGAPARRSNAVGGNSGTDPVAAASNLAGALDSPQVSLPKGISPRGQGGITGGGAEKTLNPDAVAFAANRSQHGAEGGSGSHNVYVDVSAGPVAPTQGKPAGTGKGADPLQSHPRATELASAEVTPDVSLAPLPGDFGTTSAIVPDSPFRMRAPEVHKPILEQLGGSKESEGAVERGLAYLASVQEDDGRWGYITGNNRRNGRHNRFPHDNANTGLAVLAFLAQDHRPDKEGPYRGVVSKALDFLISAQNADGDLRGPMSGGGADQGNMYDQGIATFALAEAAIMTHDPRYTEAALAGAKFIVAAQNREIGGWRYTPHEQGDSSVFGWQIMALHSAEQIGFEIPAATRKGAIKYIHLTGSGTQRMLSGYQPYQPPTGPMTAEIVFSRMLLGQQLNEEEMQEVCDFLSSQPPDRGNADIYYWYYGSLCMMQMQNDAWKQWNTRTRDTLIRMQRRSGKLGYWDGMKWGDRGGRVFTTALATLSLEVYYRYMPLQKKAEEALEHAGNDENSGQRPDATKSE